MVVIKCEIRNRIYNDLLDALFMILKNGPPMECFCETIAKEAILLWKGKKNRRFV